MSETKSPTTVLYVHSSDEMYGADVVLLELVKRLNPQEFRPIVVLPTDLPFDGALSRALLAHGAKVLHTNLGVLRRIYFRPLTFLPYLWRFIYSVAWLTRLIHSERVDIIHSNTLAVLPGAVAAWLTRTPHVWHVHEIILKPRLLWRMTSWLTAHLSTTVIANSVHTKEHLCAGNSHNQGKVVVVYNGIDIGRFDAAKGQGKHVRTEWGISPGQPVVGMIGRVSRGKGQDAFLRVAQLVRDKYPSTHFVSVGGTAPGQEELAEKLRLLVKQLGLEDVTILNDYREDAPAVLDAYDIFVVPSVHPESFGNVVLEAMAMEKPVVANAHGGCLEIVEDGITGILVSPGCPNEMAAAIKRLLEDPLERQTMGKKGRERLETLFAVDAFAKKCRTVYRHMQNASASSRLRR